MSENPRVSSAELDEFYVSMIEEHASSLVADFYRVLMRNQEARTYLDNAVVENQLKPSLIEWLREAFSPAAYADTAAFEARQQLIGQVHARISVPLHLVNEGASRLQAGIAKLIRESAQPWESRYDAMCLVYERIDWAIAVMARSYVHGVEDRARLEEGYRLFSLDQDLNLERERQRASLMEWAQATLFGILQSDGDAHLEPLSSTPFGLWVRHRAGVMFDYSPRLSGVGTAITRVDTQLLPLLESAQPGAREEALVGMRQVVDQISTLLNELFQDLTEMESGRDTLTRVMNRRFLPSILAREIAFAKKNSAGLAVMLFDIDHFKQLNDIHGHQAGDVVLRQVADVVADNLRSTDFLFRYGGEEFLGVLVEADPLHSANTAEQVRRAVAEHTFVIGNTEVPVTISIGLAIYDGHPDPDHFIERADRALYLAKTGGRNQVVLSA
ncbi:MAG: GGDEF domain-containing protein [Mycobacterium sp.]